ncbi:MAG: hypothetical protein LIO96_09925, partial [Lachnospiraceae bacterium]|nr:hypothetical protein [Lachnospiraceae bacterium]
QLTDDQHRETPRQITADTVTSFERAVVLGGRDTVTLIDDYAPAKTARQRNDLAEKLECIIRMVGDGSTKSRSNTLLEDVQGEGVQGTVVLTGELTGKGLSSNLRCFFCTIQRECVNIELLTYFQDNPFLFTTLVQNFACFVGEHWDAVVENIRGAFQDERNRARNYIYEKRLVDSTAILCLTCNILRQFLIQWCEQDRESVGGFIEQMKEYIRQMGAISEVMSTEDTVMVQIARVVEQYIDNKQMMLLQRRPNEETLASIDGFEEDGFIYFLPEKLYGIVKKFFSAADLYLPLDMNEFARALCEEGIAVASSNGKNKKTYYARVLVGNARKQNFIKINKEFLHHYVEAGENR